TNVNAHHDVRLPSQALHSLPAGYFVLFNRAKVSPDFRRMPFDQGRYMKPPAVNEYEFGFADLVLHLRALQGRHIIAAMRLVQYNRRLAEYPQAVVQPAGVANYVVKDARLPDGGSGARENVEQ